MDEDEISEKSSVPFTARLIAYHRAQESKQEYPLIMDPFAERLAGNMESYLAGHMLAGSRGDYSIVRTYYVDSQVLMPWCESHEESQIVILGSGLDARAYHFGPLGKNDHIVFEIDFDVVISYKEKILMNDRPLCRLVRVPSDLSEPRWTSQLEKAGFHRELPTLWILEGLVYYIEQEIVTSILKQAALSCGEESQIFTDVCDPGLTLAEFGPFMRHFKWGLKKEDVVPFFAESGWCVTCDYVDEHDQGRDVGQRNLIFVTGKRDLSRFDERCISSSDTISEKIPASELRAVSKKFLLYILPKIEEIVKVYNSTATEGWSLYLEFIDSVKTDLRRILVSFDNFQAVGHISSRLLRDPSTISPRSQEEEEAHIVGYLVGVVLITYFIAKGLEVWQFIDTDVYQESLALQGKIAAFPPLLHKVTEGLDNNT